MESPSRRKAKLEEISFVLQNIFIIHPNQGSKYKIRIIIHRHNREHQFKKIDHRYIFQLQSHNQNLLEHTCYLALLQKTNKQKPGQYLEVGKGQIQLSDLLGNSNKPPPVTNGVIYGTRSFNYDRIVGKYSYKISKNSFQGNRKEQSGDRKGQSRIEKHKIVNFVDHKKKQKPPQFAFKQSIISHSNDINNKIKQLTNSMNKIIGRSHDNQDEQYHQIVGGGGSGLPIIREAVFEESDYYYKYSAKVQEQLKLNIIKDFKVLTIKNIRIEKQVVKEGYEVLDKSVASTKKPSKIKKNIQVMLIFYDLYQDKKLRKRLLQIYLQLSQGTDNRFLANNLFYLPKTSRKILVEVVFISYTYNKDRSLNGVLEFSHAKSRLIQLLDSSQHQRGIFICNYEDCTEIDADEIKSYSRQTDKFQRLMRRHNGLFSSFVKKITSPSQLKQQIQHKRAYNLDNSDKDTLYSNFHPKKKPKPSIRPRMRTQVGRSINLGLGTPSVSRYRNSLSVSSNKRSLKDRSVTSSFNLDSNSVRGYPSDSQTMIRVRNKHMKQKQFTNWNSKFRLYLESIQLTLYGIDMQNKKAILKIQINDQSQQKKLSLKSPNEWHPLHMQFKQRKKDDSMVVTVLLNRPNTTKFYKVGKSHILISQFKDSSSQKYKVYLSNDNKINGFAFLNFKMFKDKEGDQKSQSFYYKQGFDREISLVSSGSKKYEEDGFENYSQAQIYPLKEQEREQFQMSIGSNQISEAKETQMQYISEKMSDKPPSQVLQEQMYDHGQAIRRKL